ncbi:MAG: twin-arginine translocation signal domain-containing protein, partial [Pseudomonadota bacterium]
MTSLTADRGLTRRQLLSRSAAAGAAFVVGPGFVAGRDAAWALETTHLAPKTMATLIQMARDIYPHDQVGDEFYAAAVKGYDSADAAPGIEAGIAALDAAAAGKGHASY